jgi:hypothetical protein
VKQNTSGLSTGGKAGIGIGAAAIFLVFLIVAVFWIRGKRHAKDSPEMVEQEQWRRQELDSTGVIGKPEMRAGATLIEMDLMILWHAIIEARMKLKAWVELNLQEVDFWVIT